MTYFRHKILQSFEKYFFVCTLQIEESVAKITVMKIFSGSSNPQLAEKVAEELKTKVSLLEIHIFPDGEKRIMLQEDVVDKDTVVVQSCSTLADSNYMELFFIIDALKRSGAKSVTAVVPYLGYQRQDHVFRLGEAVSLDVIIKTLEALKLDKLITFDLHSIKIPELFHFPVIHLSALELFAQRIKEIGENQRLDQHKSAILVSPDMGGIRRIKILSEMMGPRLPSPHGEATGGQVPFATLEKDRNLETGKVQIKASEGLKHQKRAIIVDDMISSAGTIAVAADYLEGRGVEEIFVFATHPVFSENASNVLNNLKIVKKVFVTDSVYVSESKQFEKLQVISIAKMIADELQSTS